MQMILKHRKTNSMPVPREMKGMDRGVNEGLIGKKSIKWSFSKASRFERRKVERSSEYLVLRSMIGIGRKAGFGVGKRAELSNPRGKDAPPSTTYNLPSSVDLPKVGGKISPDKGWVGNTRWTTPGPGAYNLKTCIGKGTSFTFKSRHKSLSTNYTPSPGDYNPKHTLVEPSRYTSITFGIRPKADDPNRICSPGPGSYDLTSTFASVSPTPKRSKNPRKSFS